MMDYKFMGMAPDGDGLIEKDLRDLSPTELRQLANEAGAAGDMDLVRAIEQFREEEAAK